MIFFALITFRQQQLQFRPPFEEIRSKYYREIKKFISIPKNFKGLADNQAMFQNIIQNNSHLFQTVYEKAESLFGRLLAVKTQFEDWVVLGCVDVDQLVEEKLHSVGDWELNIKMVKVKGKEAEKLPLYVLSKFLSVFYHHNILAFLFVLPGFTGNAFTRLYNLQLLDS